MGMLFTPRQTNFWHWLTEMPIYDIKTSALFIKIIDSASGVNSSRWITRTVNDTFMHRTWGGA